MISVNKLAALERSDARLPLRFGNLSLQRFSGVIS